MDSVIIKGKVLEFYEKTHQYIYDGIVLPSITQVLKIKFANKYSMVDRKTLYEAAKKGTAVHKAIELYETEGKEDDCQELHDYKFLKKRFGFQCKANEQMVILFDGDEPFCAGRLDLVLSKDGQTGLGDIKRTATLDKSYLGYQLNMYRIAYQQCYEESIGFLAGLHLREGQRRYVPIRIDESLVTEIINEYKEFYNNAEDNNSEGCAW